MRSQSRLPRLSPLMLLTAMAGCLGDVEVPPSPPSLLPFTTPTTLPRQELRGTKPKGTAVLSSGVIVVPHDDTENWSFDLSLLPGDNPFELTTQRPSGRLSPDATRGNIVYEPACPAPPLLGETPPSITRLLNHALSGSKPRGAAVVLNDTVIIPESDEVTWSYQLVLPGGEATYPFVLETRDAKGRDSDPLRFSITYDVSAPAVASRYPTLASDPVVENTGIARNTMVFAVLDEPVLFTSGDVPIGAITVRNGGNVLAGTTAYNLGASTLTWTPSADLPASVTITASIDVSTMTDLAGNPAQPGAQWSWTFATGASTDSAPPAAPTATAPATTDTAKATISGTREAFSSIYIADALVVPPGPTTSWSFELPLALGANSVAVVSRSTSVATPELATTGPTLSITRTQTRPAPPTLDAATPTETDKADVGLVGGKPPGTALLLNGVPVVCLGDETSYGFDTKLTPGFNDLRLQTRDATGAESDPVLHSINFRQAYAGKVPDGWQLRVFVNLRDLTNTRVASEFITGPNNYGIDAWVEGPLDGDESCRFDATKKQRSAIKYVATIQHYVGTKAQHLIPFADDDYRGADYLAALASGGVFSFLGLSAGSQRRAPDGRELPGVIGGLTENDVRTRIDCFGFLIDACTQATVTAGPHELWPWEPRRPPNGEILDQGDYLLWIQLSLDRSGSWVDSNDFESCWQDSEFVRVGQHRIVRRIALGSVPYSVDLAPGEELSGPDPDGGGDIKYLSDQGMSIFWGPPN